jgi:hypothetical protein
LVEHVIGRMKHLVPDPLEFLDVIVTFPADLDEDGRREVCHAVDRDPCLLGDMDRLDRRYARLGNLEMAQGQFM